jgi:DNA binding domain, excisionase family
MTIKIPKVKAPAAVGNSFSESVANSTYMAAFLHNGHPGPLLTVKQVASRWQMSERHVRRLIANGMLQPHRLGRAVRIAERDMAAFERSCR